MSLLDSLISSGTTYAILLTLSKQDPEKLGKEFGDIVDSAIDGQVGDRKSKVIEKKFAPWAVRFCGSFLKRLTEGIAYDKLDKKINK